MTYRCMLGRVMGGTISDISMQYLESFACINRRKKVSVYYAFIQRTGQAILFVDGKSTSNDFEIASVLEHRWKVTSTGGFRGSGSDLALLCSCRLCPKWSLWDV